MLFVPVETDSTKTIANFSIDWVVRLQNGHEKLEYKLGL